MTTKGYLPDRRVNNERQLTYPPRAADRIDFPRDFGLRFSVLVYVQEAFDRHTKGVGAGEAIHHIPEFQRLAEAHGVIPTYLLNHQVAIASAAQSIIGPIVESGRCVIGAQLQPWSTPPLVEDSSDANSYAGNLEASLERAKIETLTNVIAAQFGHRPVTYRAGRFGVGAQTARIISELGYRMDVSVRPRFDYRPNGGPNFTRHDARPFWAGPDAMLIAMPVGACYTGRLRRFGRYFHPYAVKSPNFGGVLARSGAIARVALTPEDMPLADVKEAVRVMIGDGIRQLNFSLHSTSLAAGHSPYVKDSADLNGLYRWWEEMFTFLAQLRVRPIASDALIAAAWSARAAR